MSAAPRRLLALLLATGVLAARAGEAAPGEDAPERPPVPIANASFVFDTEAWVLEAFAKADAAQDGREWGEAARALQRVVEAEGTPDAPGAAPYVVALRGTETFEGAARAAHHRILRGGETALAAYEAGFGSVARMLLERGLGERDPAWLRQAVQRFAPLAAGRRAALLLADLALARGDRDEALGWLARLEDLEEVTTEPPEALARWRQARVTREAVALARDAAGVEPARAALLAAALAGPAEAVRVQAELRRSLPARATRSWEMPGGGPGRAVLPGALGENLLLRWWEGFTGREEVALRPETRDRPSPLVPPRAIALETPGGAAVLVNDGSYLRGWVLEADPGRAPRRLIAGLRDRQEGFEVPEDDAEPFDPREQFGLVEGHAISAARRPGGEWMVYAAVKQPRERSEDAGLPDDHLRAFRFTGRSLARVWRVGGADRRGEVDRGIRLYGSPVPYRGRLWVGGLRPTESPDRLEAWILGLDPWTGRVEIQTLLGLANPVRKGRPDEAVPSSPAAAEGIVTLVTGLGIAAAVDAEDGRIVWLLRYDRDIVAPGRTGRLRTPSGEAPRQSVSANDPPLARLARVWMAPTDSSRILCTFNRPRAAGRELLAWRRSRLGEQFAGMAAEQLVGLSLGPGPVTLVVVGKPAATEADPPGPVAVGLDALGEGTLRWQAVSPTGATEPYGRALLTEREVFVPTWSGIAVFEVAEEPGRLLGVLDPQRVPADLAGLFPEGARAWGNLVPYAGGRGLVAVEGDWLALWLR